RVRSSPGSVRWITRPPAPGGRFRTGRGQLCVVRSGPAIALSGGGPPPARVPGSEYAAASPELGALRSGSGGGLSGYVAHAVPALATAPVLATSTPRRPGHR